MGRRSIKSTKSGKFMNPTDQARKEARKKELKKNKKQRLLVRTNVLKNKDAGTIIEELDKLDEIEYNVNEPPQLADKVLKDKRRKLKETLDRVMKLYQKDEPTYWNELKLIENDYERRRFQRIQFYEAVKQAEAVTNVEDIPLPPSGEMEGIELPKGPPPGILKHSTIFAPPTQFFGPSGREPPGVPLGVAPDLSSESESESGESDNDNEDTPTIPLPSSQPEESKKSVRFEGPTEAKPSSSSAEDEMDKFMKEVEEEFNAMKEEELRPPGMDVDKSEKRVSFARSEDLPNISTLPPPPPPPAAPHKDQRGFFQPPPPGIGQRPFFPFPPPPIGHMNMPPPRIRFNRAPRPPIRIQGPQLPPQHQQQQGKPQGKIVSEAMIQAKPQIRSVNADVTRFIPVAVRNRKDDASTKDWRPPTQPVQPKPKLPSKDDAYMDFMKEMEGLL